MGDKWTGGIVDQRGGDDPPAAAVWQPISVPERYGSTVDADGSIAYRTTFDDPRDDGTERGWLEFRGAETRVELWLNGERVGRTDPHFVPLRTAFDPAPENELVVVCEGDDSLEGPRGTETEAKGTGSEPIETDDTPPERTTPSPERAWDLRLESRPQTFLRTLEARPRRTEDGGVIDVEIDVDAGEPIDETITLSLRPDGSHGGGAMKRCSVRAGAGERVTITDSLEVREPSLWWPRGYGPQHRYTVRAKLGDDAVARTVAFRDVERDGAGMVVNGQRVRLRGFTRTAGGDPVADVERAVAANANLVRARDHVPTDDFYEACDDAGVLVWQDLHASGANADSFPSVERSRDLAAALEETFGHHPSLGFYGRPGEPSAPVDGLFGGGLLTRLRFRYRLWKTTADEASTAGTAEAISEARPVISSVGPPGTDADAALLFPGWRYLEADAIEWLLETDPDLGSIVGSFGAGSLTEDGDTAARADDLGFDPAMLERWLGESGDAEASQAHQAQTVKTVAEALRRHGCGVLAATRLRDATAGGGTGVLAHDGEAKPAYAALADSFEPIQVVLDGPPATGPVGVTLCNDTREAHEATVAWRAGDADGEMTVSVEPLETTDAGTANIPETASRIELAVRVGERTITNRYRL
ncbi:glycoside hydrolase family 2 [Natronorubrum sp. JWXQ-INN-674]|uniref:beta-mannosidase n=1 Tax=Natronorubrum halalkaliphilum TaxID=2691917 RepID=A0A6B0VQ67_9EURY|nr:glycoside hydrolase family 2 [Natronorubrum halalkaliphilum]MXV63780.1 glycoside hydrolase family 2 [Natronorubrum halalkaliphilum]